MKRASIACIIGLAVFTAWMPKSNAYQTYSQNDDATRCRMCHGDFRNSPYVSLSDGQNWGNDLHDIHRNTMLGGDCDTCHLGGDFPVYLDSSDGGTGLEAISCVGCHGRNEDIGNDSSSTGRAAGLRQHHSKTGTTVCVGCHSDADQANYSPVSEDVPPSYYFTPDSAHPNKPSESCNPSGEEDYAGTAQGLDNDGDLNYDGDDSDCATAVCGNGSIEAGEDCDDGNDLNGDCCSATCQFETAGSSCADGAFCNGDETCNGAGTCQAGTAVDCGDGVGCTDDSCDEGGDTCVNTPNDAGCPDDGLFCNGNEFCDGVSDCSSAGDPCPAGAVCNEETDTCDETPGCGDGNVDPGEDCDDGNDLNGDCCSATCQFETAGSSCADGAFCNGDETCNGAGTCQAGTAVDCGDGVGCTDDSCDEGGDTCVNTPNDAGCPDDGLFCNGNEFCDGVSDCSSAGDPCPAGAVCNEETDTCDETPGCGDGNVDPGEDCDDGNTQDGDCCSGSCQFEPAGSSCEDGEFCNGDETCDGAGTCQVGTAVDCSDGVVCTDDSCDEVGGACVNTPNDANCPDDGLFCNGDEFCDAVSDCSSAGNPCPGGTVCDEETDTCDEAPGCGDGNVDPGEDCDDGNTQDGDCCSGSCQFEPAGSSCEDGEFCNGDETCDGAGTCQVGTAVDCSDGVVCTDDSCDEVGGACVNTPNDANCPDDGLFCNGGEFCDAVSDCSSTGDPCPAGAVCSEEADTCDEISGCGNGIVEPGEGEACDDGNTQDGDCCSATCQFESAGSSCADGVFCNGDETCDGGGSCQAGTEVDCSDGVDCTDDTCDEASDTCVNTVNDANCPETDECGAGVCDPDSGDPVTGCLSEGSDELCDEVGDCLVGQCLPGLACEYTIDDTNCAENEICLEDGGTCEEVQPEDVIEVKIPDKITAKPGDSIEIPVIIEPSTGISSIGFTLTYDPEILEPQGTTQAQGFSAAAMCAAVMLSECTSATFTMVEGSPDCDLENATIQVFIESDTPLEAECGEEGVLRFLMNVIGARGQKSALGLSDVMIDGHVHGIEATAGEVRIPSPAPEDDDGGCGSCSLVGGSRGSLRQRIADMVTFVLPVGFMILIKRRKVRERKSREQVVETLCP